MKPLGRVVLSATGHGEDWSALRDHLVGLGWQVDLFDPTPRDDATFPEPTLPLLEGVDLAILLATSSGRVESAANHRLVYLAGVMQGTLGDRRVLALLENEVGPLLAGTSLTELRYKPGTIGVHFPQILALLGETSTKGGQSLMTPWLERFGVVDGRVAPEMWLALGALAVIAAVLGVFGYQLFGSSNGRLSAEVADIGGVVTTGGLSPGSTSNALPELGSGSSGAFGSEADGSVLGLPARCVVNTGGGVVFSDVIPCEEGVGGISVEGFHGPWHNEIGQVSLEAGVLGEATMERDQTDQEAGPVVLESGGTSELESRGSSFGIAQLVFVFTANGQEVALSQLSGRAGNTATLTYGLDLG